MSTLLDFDIDYTAPATPSVTVQQQTPVITETVSIRPVASQGAAYVMKSEGATWAWDDLRDYVIHEIEKRHGPQVRDARKEASIFKSFLARWGDRAVDIAKFAFGPVCDGMWRNAPISVNRFCKASDPFFAQPIADRL